MAQRSGGPDRCVNAAHALLVIATLSLVWRAWHTGSIYIAPILVPELFILSAGFVLAVCAWRSSLPRAGEFAASIIRQYWFLIILLAAPLLGLLGSSLAGLAWGMYSFRVAIDYAFLLFALLFFVIAAYIAFARPRTLKAVFAAIAISSVPFWLALHRSWQPLFLVQGNRLRGAGSDPNQLATWIAVGLIVSIGFFLWERGRVRWWWFAGGVVNAPLLLWTASRAGWFTAAVILLAGGIFFLAERFSRERVRLLGTAFLGIAASLVIGFFLFPIPSRVVIATRAASPFVSDEQLALITRWVAGGTEAVPTFEIPSDNRTRLLQEGTTMLLRSPLGFGPAYYLWNPVAVTGSEYRLGVHNAWLDIGLTAGWLGLGAWAFFMVVVGRGAVRLARRGEPQFLALAASFFALLLFGFFLGMFTVRWFWLIMGLVAAYSMLDGRGELAPAHEKQKES